MNALEKNRIVENDVSVTDVDLVVQVQQGAIDVFGVIIDRYQGKLLAYLYRLIGNYDEAQDLLQNVFIKAFRNIKSFDTERKFSSWIYRIAHNEAVNHLKRKSLRRLISWEDIVNTKDNLLISEKERGADAVWLVKEDMGEVDRAINRLPVKYKQVLILRYYSERSYEEISEILQKPINTVGTLISRAKKKMNQEIEKNRAAFYNKFNIKQDERRDIA
jgi:RNA polymerase sigma-70 factor (ECF subfamily)